MSLTNRRQVLR